VARVKTLSLYSNASPKTAVALLWSCCDRGGFALRSLKFCSELGADSSLFDSRNKVLLLSGPGHIRAHIEHQTRLFRSRRSVKSIVSETS
jgi:hypothetical protein